MVCWFKFHIIVSHIRDDVKLWGTAFIQLDIYSSGRVNIIELDVVQIKFKQFQFVQNFLASIVHSYSRYEAHIKAEIFEMIGKIKGRPAETPVIWKHIKQYLTDYQNHGCSFLLGCFDVLR